MDTTKTGHCADTSSERRAALQALAGEELGLFWGKPECVGCRRKKSSTGLFVQPERIVPGGVELCAPHGFDLQAGSGDLLPDSRGANVCGAPPGRGVQPFRVGSATPWGRSRMSRDVSSTLVHQCARGRARASSRPDEMHHTIQALGLGPSIF